MPNFIRYEAPAAPRQAGFTASGNCIAVSDLSAEEAAEYADVIREEFLKHWSVKKALAEGLENAD